MSVRRAEMMRIDARMRNRQGLSPEDSGVAYEYITHVWSLADGAKARVELLEGRIEAALGLIERGETLEPSEVLEQVVGVLTGRDEGSLV